MKQNLKRLEQMFNFATFGIIWGLGILNKKMGVLASLNIKQLHSAILMGSVLESVACTHTETRIWLFIQDDKGLQTPKTTEEHMGSPTSMDKPLGSSWKTKQGKPKTILKISKRGGVRSKNNRNKKQNKIISFSILGTNAAGLKAKKDSLLNTIKLFNFLIFQETKLQNMRNIRIQNYQVSGNH